MMAPGALSEALLAALANPVLAVDRDLRIVHVNPAAEQFFQSGASHLEQQTLDDVVAVDSPLIGLVQHAQRTGTTISEYDVNLGTPRAGEHSVNVTVAPLSEPAGHVAVSLQENTIANTMDRQLIHRGAARSVTGMAAVLAHEVKNPLSGIRGAAQLLEPGVSEEDKALTQLICAETDRIVDLVDRMERFSDEPMERGPVNIHEVLERVRAVAESGFGRGLRIMEDYDPSLPAAWGHFDQLVQIFINLVKNACEAASEQGGEILLRTAFRHGVRLEVPGGKARVRLPLEVSVQDNGGGVPADIRDHLFDPFVTTKASGSGLGLALVAKLVGDHGGVIDCTSEPRRTIFRVMLPMQED